MRILKLTTKNHQKIITETLAVLKSGGLVVFPSDTVYGLLADATNPIAVDKLLAFKERPAGKAISVFVADEKMAEKYVIINPNAANIIKNLLPGPFTVVCKYKFGKLGILGKSEKSESQIARESEFSDISESPILRNTELSECSENIIDPRLLAENGTLGFRIPDYPLINKLLTAYGLPLTATSANKSGTPPHYSIDSFLKARPCLSTSLGVNFKASPYDEINLIIDAGKLPFNKPSTVIDTTSGELKTLRMGDLLPATFNSLISRDENETSELARFILAKVTKNASGKPIVFLLKGELGTGKTVFTKGLAKALGIKENVVSPTYTLCYEYKTPSAVETRQPVRPLADAASLQRQSTENKQLSTDKPIRNSREIDTIRLHHNPNCVEQQPKSIKYPVLSIKGNGKILDTKYRILNTYLVHYDLYRIESPQDLTEIKFLESVKPGNIYSVEWPERIDEKTLLKLKEIAQIVFVEIKHVDEGTREIWWSDGAD